MSNIQGASLEEQVKKLLEQNLAYSREIYLISKKIKSYIMWGRIISIGSLFFFVVIPLILSVVYLNKPRVLSDERYQVTIFQSDNGAGSVFSVQVYYGYMQTPNIRQVLQELKEKGIIRLPAESKKWLILISVERFVSKERHLFDRFRLAIFRSIVKVSKPVSNYFGLGADPQVSIETINI